MPIDDEQFAALVRLIEDGELDDRMIDLIGAIDERNERRKAEIERLVQSVWGRGARVVGGENSSPALLAAAMRGSSPDPDAVEAIPEGYYKARDGNLYPIPGGGEPQLPTPVPDSMSGDKHNRSWPEPIQSQGVAGVGGISPVRDPMSESGDPLALGDTVSTGGQIG